jgi:uncharacterized membrane protein
MKTENIVLMQMARESLKGKWGLVVKTFFVFILFVAVFQIIPVVGTIASLILSGPLSLGLVIFILAISRNQEARLEQIFQGFTDFGRSLKAYFLIIIFVILWALLLIVPGIIAAISYSMTFFIMADDNSIEPMEAIDKSKRMMDGNKWKFFCLGLRFLGWALLCILTLGIGLLWLLPYIYVSMAKFYEDIKSN